MQKKQKLVILALCCSSLAFAQNNGQESQTTNPKDGSTLTFTEEQLGEDESMSQNITILNSNTNMYASEVGYLFSPLRFRYRAFNQKYNDIYINGSLMNDMESGQFRYSLIGGLNQQTRNVDSSLPFESNNFAIPGMAGSNNYDFRAGSMPTGNRFSIGAANRSYTLRGMYTYASGFNSKGWAFAGNLTYRWAKEGYVPGTFYNSLSYYLAIQKRWNNGHSLSLSTFGNPTERASQGASTDEVYWLANDRMYNPYWGYQNGHKRNSRVVNDFAPTALLTWDWDINKDMKLTTTLSGKYSFYKSTKLNYNNSENPQPDYWKNLPSSYYDVWSDTNVGNNEYSFAQWQRSVNFWQASEANRQINWDRLYWANIQNSKFEKDALYYVQAEHNNNLALNLSSTLTTRVDKNKVWNLGFMLGQNIGMHYQTMEDLLGATSFHNINTYALGTYDASTDAVQYDLNTMGNDRKGKIVNVGDRFAFDYNLLVRKGSVWSTYSVNTGGWHLMAAAKMGGTSMQREGNMRNGLFANNSYGKSGTAHFGEAGGKGSISYDTGNGHVFSLGAGYEWQAPLADNAFVSPEMNNDFVLNLKDEHVFSSEFGYQFQNSRLHLNLNAYYSYLDHVSEWQNFFFDDINSFSYVSMTGIEKEYYGVELGLNYKLTSFLDFKALGTMSDAKNVNNANVWYMSSTKATYNDATKGAPELVMNDGMRESGTPLNVGSLGLSFHQSGWFIDLNANYYDRIYLSYSPSMRYESTLKTMGSIDNEGNYIIPEQAKGHGGWMVDGSIGRTIRLKSGQLSFNLMVNNILNNENIVSGGYEQSRSDYTVKDDGTISNQRTYRFSKNPKKYYVFGTNGMFQVSYRF